MRASANVRYSAAADEAADAHAAYTRSGEWARMSEALMVQGQSRALDGDYGAGLRLLDEAMRIAQQAPYPERQTAAASVFASVADTRGDVDQILVACVAGIDAAEATGHVAEIAELHFLHAVALAEVGDYAAAATAYDTGLDSLTAWPRACAQLACGLAEMLLLTGCPDRATEVLDAHDVAMRADARHLLHATTVRWRAGRATDTDVRAAAVAAAEAGLPPLATVVFALARLSVPGPDAGRWSPRGASLPSRTTSRLAPPS